MIKLRFRIFNYTSIAAREEEEDANMATNKEEQMRQRATCEDE